MWLSSSSKAKVVVIKSQLRSLPKYQEDQEHLERVLSGGITFLSFSSIDTTVSSFFHSPAFNNPLRFLLPLLGILNYAKILQFGSPSSSIKKKSTSLSLLISRLSPNRRHPSNEDDWSSNRFLEIEN
ncbi:unnamed protein product [Lactuca saligna]|uniref:Uncharacterized protein n=1 Tax=Lactuca saligna TaxID=75948 RepID=A0AA35VIT9_LACSI|nr:unnamed protein product [Lactuca saligna]